MNNTSNKNISIENIVSGSFGQYAKYIIQDRALPDVRDGLKPVQRRIIYAMQNLNLLHDLPHRKSARTVGEVIGKYHPHGDSSIYEAMVRLAQEWKNNICLLDMHGNKGSIDGDGPAAMRYTECRLSLFGEMMTYGIKKDVVQFIPNFDGSENEPTVLPTIYPNLLINGANGIAAGYATNIPPFNPSEVIDAIIAKIDSPNCHLSKILSVMPAPDFPTGGIISNLGGINEAYKTGKGKISIAGEITKLNNKQISITSIPFETNKMEIIKQIDLAKDKVKTLEINEVRDESDANGVNIILEISTKANFDFIKNYLYKNTKLKTSFNFNMIAIKERKPILLDIWTFLQSFIDHAENIILKISKFDLDKAKERKEIIIGLIKAISIIDDIVSCVRSANNKDDAINNLINNFSFSINQANAIVQLRLYRLTNTDVQSLEKELNELNITISKLENLVNSKESRLLELKTKLRLFKKQFPQPRKSKISNETNQIEIDEFDLIENKNRIYMFTLCGYVKSFSNKALLANDQKDNATKSNDFFINGYVANKRDRSLLFISNGNCVVIPNNKISECKFKDIGNHINNLISSFSDATIIAALNASYKIAINKTQIIICTQLGLIKRCELSEMITKRQSIINYYKLDENDKIVSVFPINNENEQIIICSKSGYINRYQINQIPLVGKNAKGVKAMSLKNNDTIASCFLVNDSIKQVAIVTNAQIKRIDLSFVPIGNRTNVGKLINSFILKNNDIKIIKILPLKERTILVVINSSGEKEFIQLNQINYLDNNTRINFGSKQIINCNVLQNNIENLESANE